MPRTTFTHLTKSGETATRQSATKTYTHVVVDAGTGDVLRWSESAQAARAALGSKDLGGKDRAMKVEAVNNGKRKGVKPNADANPKADALKKDANKERGGMSTAERKKLAAEIIRLRSTGLKWDGEGGVCEKVGIRTALVGRALMREYGAGDQIKPLTGSRAQ